MSLIGWLEQTLPQIVLHLGGHIPLHRRRHRVGIDRRKGVHCLPRIGQKRFMGEHDPIEWGVPGHPMKVHRRGRF